MKTGKRHLVFSSLLLALGCEQGVTVRGTVTVPIEVQQLLSGTMRGRVLVVGKPKDGDSWLGPKVVGVLCDPAAGSLTFPFTLSRLGCAKEATLTATADPLPSSSGNLPCGAANEGAGGEMPEGELASGSEVVFAGHTAGSCGSDDANVAVT